MEKRNRGGFKEERGGKKKDKKQGEMDQIKRGNERGRKEDKGHKEVRGL